MNYTVLLADRTENMSGNIIREILKATANPKIVSLAGGLPAPETFPIDVINKLHETIMSKYGSKLFQYSTTEGFMPFREAVAQYVQRFGIDTDVDNVSITSGSQGSLDAIAKILLNKGDYVAVEAPTYLGAMTAFNPYQPNYVEIETDDEGIIPQSLEQILKTHKVKIIYLVPTFQNPTGRTLSLVRRKEVAALLQKYNIIAVEDNPYGELRYVGERIPSIKSLAPEHIIYVGTLSKVFAPGMRLGFHVAPKELGKWLTFAKQGIDIHTHTYGQALATEYLREGYLDSHLPHIIEVYKPRYQAMLATLKESFSDEFRWSIPEGGMFIWIQAPERFNTDDLYWKAIEQHIAYVPGRYFFSNTSKGLSTMRLNFTNMPADVITKAVRTLANVFERNDNK